MTVRQCAVISLPIKLRSAPRPSLLGACRLRYNRNAIGSQRQRRRFEIFRHARQRTIRIVSSIDKSRQQQLARTLFALSIASLGILAFVYSHLGLAWYSVPAWVPWRGGFTFASGIILLSCGVGLLVRRFAQISACILFPYLVIWLLMRVPTLVSTPLIAVVWENAAEIATLVVGAWVLFARLDELREKSPWRFATGANGMRAVRMLLGLSLVAFGVAHFAYVPQTVRLVPPWLPFRNSLAYVTGTFHVAAGIGVLFSIYPRLAAMMEALMLGLFTLIVWIPATLAAPTSMPTLTEIIVSTGVTAGVWVVAESIAAHDDLRERPTKKTP